MRRVAVPEMRALPALPRGQELYRLHGLTMGTSWSVSCVGAGDFGAEGLAAAIQAMLDALVAEMSTFDPASALSRYNGAAAGEWVTLSADLHKVVKYAAAVAEASGGAYDPTVGPLVNLWGFGPDPCRNKAPDDGEIAAARARVGWRRMAFAPDATALLQPGGVYVDLSAIAKGFAVDRVAALLDDAGIENYLVEIGGELRGQGMKPDGQPWWVALDPVAGLPDFLIALHGLSIATSGDSLRYFEDGGQRFCHAIDPRSGYPVANGVSSISLIHPECICADALSTALMVMAPDEAYAFAVRNGLAARFLLRRAEGFEERLTPALQAML